MSTPRSAAGAGHLPRPPEHHAAFDTLLPALDPALAAGATIAVEMYATESAYCAAARGGAEAGDRWLADFFLGGRGSSPRAGFAWLAERRRRLGSRSHLTAVFGVTDTYMDGRDPFVFLDRMFYVWMTRTGFPGTLAAANGGRAATSGNGTTWTPPPATSASRPHGSTTAGAVRRPPWPAASPAGSPP